MQKKIKYGFNFNRKEKKTKIQFEKENYLKF